MNDKPRLNTDILRAYFNNTKYQDDKYLIEITLISGDDHFGFIVCIDFKEPGNYGAFPQRRWALEQHKTIGHEGVHVQVNYHMIDNDINLGRLHITLDIHSDKELLEIGEGFVYTLYEMLSSFGDD